MYSSDIVVHSELRKSRRDTGLVARFEGQRCADVFLSVISIGEIEGGVVRQRASNVEFATTLAARGSIACWPFVRSELFRVTTVGPFSIALAAITRSASPDSGVEKR
ncbi:hypothetical protein [Rhodoplanes sp. SY1]|uniref:hypothetical protein n=1 Tax=Rhodoplanes sp. SY1 TaxID=3166646 RepID=UPI0038B4782B